MSNAKPPKLPRPWTLDELRAQLPEIERRVAEHILRHPTARPLPPMTPDEALDLFARLADVAGDRALSLDECALLGQVVAAYGMAVRAETLGKRGRFFVLSEADLARALGEPP